MAPRTGQPPLLRRRGSKLPWVLLALVVLVGLFLLFRDRGTGTDSGNLTLGSSTELASQRISAQGGAIAIASSASVLNGMTLTVPESAYAGETDFTIRETEVETHAFGDLFTPVTPLISIDNGHEYANLPMRLTIPISISDDEFAMAFYYDRETGALEGIPFLDASNASITLLTSHFSDLIVSKVRTDRIMDDVDTGFRPNRDDIQVPNYGSWLNPGGHCAGQTFANIVYWKHHKAGRAGWDIPLNERFNNVPGREKTLGFVLDDALVQRLSSVIHKNYAVQWRAGSDQIAQYKADHSANDRKTYFAFAYSMALTGLPQMMDIRGYDPATKTSSAHAILIYAVSGNELLVCDPNFPGSERVIRFDPAAMDDGRNPSGAFEDYSSGDDASIASTNATAYGWFGYIGLSALVDVGQVTQIWVDAMETGGANLIDPLFPSDQELHFVTGMDANAQPIVQPLTDGVRIPPSALALSFNPGSLYLAPHKMEPDVRITFYLGNDGISRVEGAGVDVMQYASFALPNGKTDLGVMTEVKGSDGEFHYLNFRRFVVIAGDAVLSVSPETASIATGEIVNFRTTLTGTVEAPVYVWDFNDGTEPLQGNLPELPHLYAQEGSFTGTVSVREERSPSMVLADATFTIEVGAPPAATPEPQAQSGSGYAGLWAVRYTNLEECQHTSGIQQIEHGLRYGEIGGASTEYMQVPLTMELQVSDGNVTDNGDGTVTISQGGTDGYVFVGSPAENGSLSGTFTETYGQGKHWIKGTFRMTRK